MRTQLTDARNRKKLTHEDVAKKAGITRQYYGMIEKGERTPSVSIAKKIGKVLEVDWTIFFETERNLGLLNEDIATTP